MVQVNATNEINTYLNEIKIQSFLSILTYHSKKHTIYIFRKLLLTNQNSVVALNKQNFCNRLILFWMVCGDWNYLWIILVIDG